MARAGGDFYFCILHRSVFGTEFSDESDCIIPYFFTLQVPGVPALSAHGAGITVWGISCGTSFIVWPGVWLGCGGAGILCSTGHASHILWLEREKGFFDPNGNQLVLHCGAKRCGVCHPESDWTKKADLLYGDCSAWGVPDTSGAFAKFREAAGTALERDALSGKMHGEMSRSV